MTPPHLASTAARLAFAFALATTPMVARGTPADTSGSATPDYASLGLEALTQLDVVVGASRIEQSLAEAPAAVTVIGEAEIRAAGYATLGEALASATGMYVTDDRNYLFVGVRGFHRPGDYNSHVLLLLDGHRLNDEVVEQGAIGRDAVIDMALIERIEIIRGPSSSLYGSNAMFAVVNVITKSSVEHPSVSLLGGSRSTGGARAMLGSDPGSRARWIAGGEYFQSRGEDLRFGEFVSASHPLGLFAGGDREQAGRAYWKLTTDQSMVMAAVSTRSKRIPTASFESLFGDDRARTWDTRALVELKHRLPLARGAEWSARLFYDLFDYHGDYPYEAGAPLDTLVSSDQQRAQWGGGEIRWVAAPWRGHRALAGTKVRFDLGARQRVWDRDPEFVYFDDRHGSNVWSAYAQDEWRIAPPLALHLAVRHDTRTSHGSSNSPRAALLLTPHPGTTAKLIWGEAFRAPTPYELNYDDGGLSQKRNPALDSEHSRHLEGVLEHQFGPTTRLAATLFQTDVRGLIEQVIDPTDSLDVFRNQSAIRARGTEFEFTRRFAAQAQVRASYSFQSVRDRTDHRWLSNSPRHIAALTVLSPRHPKAGQLALEVQYMSPRLTLGGTSLPAYTLVHARLGELRIAPRLMGAVRVRNLLDTPYGTIAGPEHVQSQIPAPRRSWWASIELR